MNIPWPSYDYVMIVLWLSYDFLMTMLRWSYGYLMVILSLPKDYVMAISWVSCYLMVILWLSHDWSTIWLVFMIRNIGRLYIQFTYFKNNIISFSIQKPCLGEEFPYQMSCRIYPKEWKNISKENFFQWILPAW